MDKTIVTALLIIAGVISAIAVFNAILPAVTQSGDAMNNMERRIDDRMQSQIEIIHATRDASNNVLIWVKNVGNRKIAAPKDCDLFFGPDGNFTRIPYSTGTSNWTYTIENDTEWRQGATLKIVINNYPPSGVRTYFIKIVLPNGISTETFASW